MFKMIEIHCPKCKRFVKSEFDRSNNYKCPFCEIEFARGIAGIREVTYDQVDNYVGDVKFRMPKEVSSEWVQNGKNYA